MTVHVDDGRSFLRKSTDKYDLIIFALPDSLTLTSQFSEPAAGKLPVHRGVDQARRARHLTGDGALVLYNYYRQDWLLRKLAGMLETAFGPPPYVTELRRLGPRRGVHGRPAAGARSTSAGRARTP